MTDTTPDAFSFAPKRDVEVNTAIDSEAVTITGINAPTEVEITPPAEYQIDDGAFTSEPGSVSNNQTITVRLTSAAKAEQTTSATLTVGDQTATFDVTTAADMTAPEVAIQFPPPASMTEGDTIYIRGESSDLHGSVANITINGEMVTTEDDYATWSVELPLAEGENTLTVTATDMAGNVNDGEAVSVRKVADITGESFPDNENPFENAFKIDVGVHNGQFKVFVVDSFKPSIMLVDLETGSRHILSDNIMQPETPFDEPLGVHFGENNKLYVSDYSSTIFEIDLETNLRSRLISGVEAPILERPIGMYLDIVDGVESLYVADSTRISRIDISTKEVVVISDASTGLPDGENPFNSLWSLAPSGGDSILASAGSKLYSVNFMTGKRTLIEEVTQGQVVDLVFRPVDGQVLFVNSYEDAIYTLDMGALSSQVRSSAAVPDMTNAPVDIWGMTLHEDGDYALAVDSGRHSVFAVDIETGRRVIISKSAAEAN